MTFTVPPLCTRGVWLKDGAHRKRVSNLLLGQDYMYTESETGQAFYVLKS